MKIIKKGLVKRARQLLLPGIILMFSFSSTRARQAPITCNGPLNERQLAQLLQAGVADLRVEAFVTKCGVDFGFTPDVESRLREAGASDALIKLVQARSTVEQQKKEREVERLKQAAIDEQRNREAVRLAELRRKLGLDPSGAQYLPLGLTLDEAREALTSLRDQTRDIEARLKTQYADLTVKPTLTKDMFESTAEFHVRQSKVIAEHKDMEDHYLADLAALTADYYKQIAELLSQKYAMPALKVKSITYDADEQLLIATIDDVHYRFSVEPAKARVWYEHQHTLELRGNFLKAEENKRPSADEIILLDPQTREELNGRNLAAELPGKWKAKVVWKATGDEYLTFNFSAETNTTELSGTIDSSVWGGGYALLGSINADSVTFTTTVKGTLWQFEGTFTGSGIRIDRNMGRIYSDEFTAEKSQ